MNNLAAITDLLGTLPKVDAATAAVRRVPALSYAPIPVPELALPLLDFQREGVERALTLRRALIADEMGLGKTPQGIACAVAAVENLGQKPVLVVVPPALRTNWVREFAKFAPNVRVDVLLGTKGGRIPAGAQVLVLGDASLSGKTVKTFDQYGKAHWETTLKGWALALKGQIGALIVDEAHRFKNYKAGRTVALTDIAEALPGDAIRVLLTGTPVENYPGEVTSQLQILDRLRGRQQFGSLKDFQDRYCPVIDDWGTRGSANTVELGKRLRDLCMIRRLRKDVVSLPGKGRNLVALDLDPATMKRYAWAEDDLRSYLEATKGRLAAEKVDKAEAIIKLNTLRQLAAAGKIKATIEYVQNLLDQGEQVFIATWHRPTADALYAALSAKTTVGKIVGGVSAKQRDAAVDGFQAGDLRVMIGNIRAAGVGFTLTAARHIVVAELPWNPSALKQVEDRLDRIGQTRKVVVHITIAAIPGTSIDAHVWGIIENKATVVGEVLDGEADVLVDGPIAAALLDCYRS